MMPAPLVYQLGQFDDMIAWARHQENVAQDTSNAQRRGDLFPNVDFCDTAILRLADSMPTMPVQWPEPDFANPSSAGIFEQRTIWMRPGASPTDPRSLAGSYRADGYHSDKTN